MATKCKCPICGRPSDFNAPPIGTFCSERCKLIDLGKWLDGEFRVPGDPVPEAPDDEEDDGRG